MRRVWKIMLMRLFFIRRFVSERKQISLMADEKSPLRISHRHFAIKSFKKWGEYEKGNFNCEFWDDLPGNTSEKYSGNYQTGAGIVSWCFGSRGCIQYNCTKCNEKAWTYGCKEPWRRTDKTQRAGGNPCSGIPDPCYWRNWKSPHEAGSWRIPFGIWTDNRGRCTFDRAGGLYKCSKSIVGIFKRRNRRCATDFNGTWHGTRGRQQLRRYGAGIAGICTTSGVYCNRWRKADNCRCHCTDEIRGDCKY